MRKNLWSWICLIFISWGLVSCSDTIESVQAFNSKSSTPIPKAEKIAEVAPPKLIQELGKTFAQYQPQVAILSPKNNQTFEDTTVKVQLQVKDLPIFKDETLNMGPHLHFFVDAKPYQAIYNPDEPIILEDLTPGTHTIRVFASRPWHESFKNEGAYAQTTFHIFTPTDDNNPDLDKPLLTYSRPQGTYGAEPIMLDYYLTNAPLHLVAEQEEAISDWRIRVTVNGENFLLDTWQPIYLQGFNKGQNWVKLEFINEKGETVKNAFNSTVRVINYDPKKKDTLSRLVKGKISLEQARAIVEQSYEPSTISEEEELTPPLNPEVLPSETVEEIVPPETESSLINTEPETNIESSETETKSEEMMPTEETSEVDIIEEEQKETVIDSNLLPSSKVDSQEKSELTSENE